MQKSDHCEITVVLPTYRRPELLQRAICSVLEQTYPHFKVKVFDNASHDDTEKVVKAFSVKDSRVEYFCHAENIGSRANFQYGLSQVDTPFFSFLSDDDFLLPNFFEIALEKMSQYSKARFFIGSTIDMTATGEVLGIPALFWQEGEYFEPPQGLYETVANYINWTGSLFHRDVLKKVCFDQTAGAGDFDFVVQLAAHFPFVVSKTPCAVFTHSVNSDSSSGGLALVWPCFDILLRKLENNVNFSEIVQKRVEEVLKKELKKSLFRIFIHSLEKRKFLEAEAALKVYTQNHPSKRNEWILAYVSRTLNASRFFHKFFVFLLKCYRKNRRRNIY